MKRQITLGFLFVVCLNLFINSAFALPWDTPETYTWYNRADTHTVNTVLGYQLGTAQTNIHRTVSSSAIQSEILFLNISEDTPVYYVTLHQFDQTRAGQKLSIAGKTLSNASFLLSKFGSPTGNFTCVVRRTNDSIIQTSPTEYNITTLTEAWVWYNFELSCYVNEEVRVCVEYSGGSSDNYLRVRCLWDDVDVGVLTYYATVGGWTDDTGWDCNIMLYEILPDVYWGVKVFRVAPTGRQTELTDGTYDLNVTRNVDAEGLQTLYWTPSLTNLAIGLEAIRLNVYIRPNATIGWQHKATFITEILLSDQLINATWTFYLYTQRAISGSTVTATFHWGTETYNSRIANVQLAKIDPWQEAQHQLREGDLVLFMLTPWLYFIGNLIYGIIVLFVAVTTYTKYNSLKPTIVMLWLFAGAGGMLTSMIPALGLYLAWFLLAVALASSILYVLFR